MELAGEVEAVGKAVKRFKKGDQIFASTSDEKFGAHAEYKCLSEDGAIAAKPSNVTYEEAAALSIGATTALSFLQKADIHPGQKVLINGASGSVGSFAVQLAKYFGAEVTAVCSTPNTELVKSLGADKVVDYTQEDFTRNGEIYDIIFDAVGKTNFSQCRHSLKNKGYYLHTGMAGSEYKALWHSRTTGKTVIGGTVVPRARDLKMIKELTEMGRVKPVIDRRYPFEQAAEAHLYVDQGRKKGSVTLTLNG